MEIDLKLTKDLYVYQYVYCNDGRKLMIDSWNSRLQEQGWSFLNVKRRKANAVISRFKKTHEALKPRNCSYSTFKLLIKKTHKLLMKLYWKRRLHQNLGQLLKVTTDIISHLIP